MPKVKAVVQDDYRTASSTKNGKSSKTKRGAKVGAKRSAPIAEEKPQEVGDLPINREVSKKRKLKGKLAKLA